jgi:hypothetical protein
MPDIGIFIEIDASQNLDAAIDSVTINIYYDDIDDDGFEDQTGIDETTLAIYWWDGATWVVLPGGVDTVNNYVWGTIGHFSVFGVLSDENATNIPPTADPNGPYEGEEGSEIIFHGEDSYDPDGTVVQYDWDLDGDGVFETVDAGPNPTYTWGDDYYGIVGLKVMDDNGTWSDEVYTNVTIYNVPPMPLNVEAYMFVDFTLIVDGVEWEKVEMYLYEDDIQIGYLVLFHPPGSPDFQTITLFDVKCDMTKHYTANVIYTPPDPPGTIGSTGVYISIILTFEDFTREIYEHMAYDNIFSTHGWFVDFSDAFIGHEITFKVTALDPGADDLIFEWFFGDHGTAGPNFYPSDGTYPTEVTDIVYHTYYTPGIFTVFVIISDDDGGGIGVIFEIRLGVDNQNT